MKRFCICGLAALLVASPAPAQNIAADVQTAFSVFVLGNDASQLLPPEGAAALIGALEGRWLPVDVVFPDGAYDTARAADVCARLSFDLVRTGSFNFTLTRLNNGEPTEAVVNYAWVGGTTFTRTVDLDGQLETLFGDDWENRPSAMWSPAFRTPQTHGYGLVHMIGQNALVIEDVASRPQIFARCAD